MKDLEIVVPVKNEEKNIPELTRLIDLALTPNNITYNIIYVVDKSSDRTIEVIQECAKDYPIIMHEKLGKGGKGYSLLEGTTLATSEYVGFIDGDLQYPASAIPEMYRKIKADDAGVVVANRKVYKCNSFARKFGSAANIFIFGRLLLGFKCDMQSGLKLFRRDILKHVDTDLVTPWTFDIPLLHAATELGEKIIQVDIEFENRVNGASKVGFIKTALGIIACAVKTRLRTRRIYHLDEGISKVGSGIVYLRKKYVTHTNLPHEKSAIYTLVRGQKFGLLAALALLIFGLVTNAMLTATVFIAILSTIYFLDVIFNLYLVLKSLHQPPEVKIDERILKNMDDGSLPVYTIMCPLYKEAEVLPQFIENVQKMNWPKDKLEVLLLLEENDPVTIEAARNMALPAYVKTVVVPHSMPKTKPKACNYGLHMAKGEYVVVYDAEDQPDPDQLRKAYLAFQESDEKIFCVQAKLNYYNPDHNLLTRLFTAEYSLWFDVILPGLQSIQTTIPLGGTSNHFRTANLKVLHGWDPFNVTEDCDLGVRLFKEGYKTAIVDSVTLEEANSGFINWIRQRSRWIKGYMQTYFVHMRNPVAFLRKNGWHALIFQLVIGLRIYFMLINPILWLATLSYFVLYRYVGPTIEALYPTPVFYMAVVSLVFGNFTYLYNYMIGCAKREHWGLIKFVFLVPFYWVMMSAAAVVAFYQLIFKPHHWEKTHHGLHLKKAVVVVASEMASEGVQGGVQSPGFGLDWIFAKFHKLKQFANIGTISAGALIAASLFGNFFNYLYNGYLSRSLTLEDFGLISLVGNFIFLVSIPTSALSRSVTHKTAFYLGKFHKSPSAFWSKTRKDSLLVGVGLMIVWAILVPLLKNIFQSPSYLPFLIFTPVWLIGTLAAVDGGFLTGNMKFFTLAIMMVVESVFKFVITVILVQIHHADLVYAAIPVSMLLSFLIGYFFAIRIRENPIGIDFNELEKFPSRFFSTSLLMKFAGVAFLSFDIILAKIYLSPIEAGQYALISLIGKMIYFIGTLFGQFVLPIVSSAEGARKNSRKAFRQLFIASSVASAFIYLLVGPLGFITAPILFGSKILSVVRLLPVYGAGMLAFSMASTIIGYHQIRTRHVYTHISFILAVIQVALIMAFHDSLGTFVRVMTVIGVGNLAIASVFHYFGASFNVFWQNAKALIELFTPLPKDFIPSSSSGLKVLMYNWRDTKHIWAGGAEIYLHEVAKEMIKRGSHVTLFCGNDTKNPTYEIVEGVRVIRKGGFFTVYIWAFLYYLFKLRKHVDVIVDSENGVPFFTPIYSRKPVVGLVHHIHQEVFRRNLPLLLSDFACFLEAKLMPFVYRNTKMITVSDSSKKDMEKLGFGKKNGIEVANPGINPMQFHTSKKTLDPSILYLGRLMPWKSVDTVIRAMKGVLKEHGNARLRIAGFGGHREELEILTRELGLEKVVEFLGKVSEEDKVRLMGESWVFVYPSSMEGWGIANIEANACGTPVVAADVPGLRDSVRNPTSGFLVEHNNVDEFAKRISELIGDKNLRSRLSNDARGWAENFTWERSADTFLRVLEGVRGKGFNLGERLAYEK